MIYIFRKWLKRRKRKKVILFTANGETKFCSIAMTHIGPIATYHSSPSILLKNGCTYGVCYVKKWAPVSGWTELEIKKYYGDINQDITGKGQET